MSLFSIIRERYGMMALKRANKHLRRKRCICNMENASRIGVLYYLPDEETYDQVSTYVKKLQDAGKTVKALGYVHSKRLTGKFLPKLSYDFLYPSGLNWYLKPKAAEAKDFIENDFDILIDLSMVGLLPLLFITATSNARFKTGLKSDRRSGYLDLMIDLGGEEDLGELIRQIDHYLSIINKKHEN